MQCGDLVQIYDPLIKEELHWWEEKGITKDLLDRSTDAKVLSSQATSYSQWPNNAKLFHLLS